MDFEIRELFQGVLLAAIQRRADIEWRQVASDWGVSFKSLNRWIALDGRFPAEFIVPLCRVLGSFELLDYLERAAGRTATSLPDQLPTSPAETFRDGLRRVLDDPSHRIDQKLTAERIGIDYRQLRYFVGNDPERRFPAELVVPLCQTLMDYRLLDCWEYQAGRLAFHKPDLRPPGLADISEFHKLLEESLETVKIASASMRDNRVDAEEAILIVSELDTVLRHCLRLRLWLDSTFR